MWLLQLYLPIEAMTFRYLNSLQITSHLFVPHLFYMEVGLPAFWDTWYTDLTYVSFFLVVAIQWLHYTPQWCHPYRRYLKKPATLEQCKQACLPGCAAIEYWPVDRTCNECLDHTKRTPFTNTFLECIHHTCTLLSLELHRSNRVGDPTH